MAQLICEQRKVRSRFAPGHKDGSGYMRTAKGKNQDPLQAIRMAQPICEQRRVRIKSAPGHEDGSDYMRTAKGKIKLRARQ